VEENPAAIAAIERNLARTKLEGRIRRQDVFSFLHSTQTRAPFQIIFADPPYEKTKSGGKFTSLLLEDPQLAAMLGPSGIFVLEKRPAEQMPGMPLWNVTRARAYGATEVLFLQRADIPAEVRAR
jgi:16S rRNA (guanine966-N2)-methyltransferase